jgi:hypothetical protein
MKTEDKNKRFVKIEIEDDVKRLTITGQDEHDQVVMRQELSDDELDGVAGGESYEDYQDFYNNNTPCAFDCPFHDFDFSRP